jgi:hypothetical protein
VPTDLTGGLDPELELFLKDRPIEGEMRDSATLWVMDDSGVLAFPRVTLDAIAAHWDRPWLQLNMVHQDGRTFRVWDRPMGYSRTGKSGAPTLLGAGPLRLECIEPFRHWTMTFEGSALQSTTRAQMAGHEGGSPIDLRFHFDATMAAPPWLMGGMTAQAARNMKQGDAALLMGGVRYEQLCRIAGTANIGREKYTIRGTGMRVRRQGIRRMNTSNGHCQHSALFPSGRGFGAIAFPPRADGTEVFNEGFVIGDDGVKHAARVIEAPWMKRLVSKGEPVPLVLQSDLGTLRIAGETILSTFDTSLFEMADTSVLQQGAVRYTWDGESTIGLIERCTLRTELLQDQSLA